MGYGSEAIAAVVDQVIGSVHLILYVTDQVAATAFWQAVLDCPPTLDVLRMTEFALGTGVVLGLMPETGIRSLLGPALPDPAAGRGIPRAELYLVVDDAAAYHARARAAGRPNCPRWPGGRGGTMWPTVLIRTAMSSLSPLGPAGNHGAHRDSERAAHRTPACQRVRRRPADTRASAGPAATARSQRPSVHANNPSRGLAMPYTSASNSAPLGRRSLRAWRQGRSWMRSGRGSGSCCRRTRSCRRR